MAPLAANSRANSCSKLFREGLLVYKLRIWLKSQPGPDRQGKAYKSQCDVVLTFRVAVVIACDHESDRERLEGQQTSRLCLISFLRTSSITTSSR